MRDTARKWGKRLLWLLPAILAIYLAGLLADFAWFRCRIPVAFQSANWSGVWRTQQYGGFGGRLLVHLPDPLPENHEFQAEALVYYPIYCPWKTGRFVKMDFSGLFTPDSPVSNGQSTNRIPGGGMLKFKGVAGDQTVEYTALIDKSGTDIVGGYLSTAPDDYGWFEISSP